MDNEKQLALSTDIVRRGLVALKALASDRRMLAAALGQHTAYHGLRDYYTVLGYKESLEIDDFKERYDRQGIASRIVDSAPLDTWKRPPTISTDGESDFVEAWRALTERLHVWDVLSRADRLSGIGQFGIILIGMRGGSDLSQPAASGSLSAENDILFLRPLSQSSVEIQQTEESTASERFGQPTMYGVTLADSNQAVKRIHWTRALHLADGKLESLVYGTPRLQKVFNDLDDLMKVAGGAAEATWLNMRGGTVVTNREGYDFPDDDEAIVERREQFEEYLHGIARMMVLEGVDVQQLQGQIMNPSGPFDVVLSLISAATGIPRRILLGSAAGELAAAKEDTRQWYGQIAERQKNYAEPQILRPFISHLQFLGALPPTPRGYNVGTLQPDGSHLWPSLFSLDELEQSEIAQRTAAAARNLADPFTGRLPITDGESRQLLGYPIEPPGQAERGPIALVANAQEDYGRSLRGAAAALWRGDIDVFEFASAMGATVRRQLRLAWLEGAQAAGIREEELTAEELAVLTALMQTQIDRVDPFADFIIANNRASGAKLSALNPRLALWEQFWLTVRHRAMMMARTDPKLRFNLGPTIKHCSTCLRLNGKVKRASQWRAAQIGPQTEKLECVQSAGGITNVCQCFFSQTDEAMSKGPLPKGV